MKKKDHDFLKNVQKFRHRNFFSFFKISKILSIVNNFFNKNCFSCKFRKLKCHVYDDFSRRFFYHPFLVWKQFRFVSEYSYSLQFNQCHKPVAKDFMSWTINATVTATLLAIFALLNKNCIRVFLLVLKYKHSLS